MKILSKLDNTGMIDEVADKRYVTDAEKSAWNSKADKTYVDNKVKTDVPSGAKFTDTVYSHPSSHPASMITESSTKRFVTDAEKLKWNGGVVPNIGNFISQEQLIGYVIMNQLSSGLYKTGIGDASDCLLLIHDFNTYYQTTAYSPNQIVYAKVSKTGDILDFQEVWCEHLYKLNQVDNKVESYGTNPVLNIAVISAGGSTTGIPNNTLILELE